MSKRNGAVSPDVLIEQYGSDVFRMYLGFGFSFMDGGPWDDEGIKSIARFITRIGRMLECFEALSEKESTDNMTLDSELEYIIAEEMWQYIGNDYSVHSQLIPKCDESKLNRDTVKIAFQVM